VPFFETDAMGVVHHSNVAAERHFAVIRLEVDYRVPVGFDEEVTVTVWPQWVKGATLRMAYRLETPRGLVAPAATEHAMVDGSGRPRRIPREERDALRRLCGDGTPEPPARSA
jgi:acyl-CoA thioesterase FadM